MTGSMDKFSRLWDLRTSQPFHEWEHNGEVGADDVTPDGRFIITGSRDKTAGLWVATTGAKLDNIPLGDGLRSLAFSPNGRLALSGSLTRPRDWWISVNISTSVGSLLLPRPSCANSQL